MYLHQLRVDAQVRLHLRTTVMRCSFRRAAETQKALGDALAAGVAESHQDVHDRALLYYRLLQYDVSVAERIANPPKQAVSVFADTQSIFDEFNSLSVVYQKEISIDPRGLAGMTNHRALLPQRMTNQSPIFKFFFFTQKAEGLSAYLVEYIINSSSWKVQLKIKADD